MVDEILDIVKNALYHGEKKFTQQAIEKLREQIKRPMNSDKDRVEIIILKYKNPEIEKECVSRIIDNTDWPYKLTFYNNEDNSANMAKIWNKLVKESTCEMVVIMDSDAFVEPGWLSPLVKCLKRRGDAGMITPVCGKSGATIAQCSSRKDWDEVSIDGHLSGFCFLTTKSVVEKVGWFDENFYVFGQDSDFCEKLRAMDYKLFLVYKSLVYHGYRDKQDENKYQFSISTNQARDNEEFDWVLDVHYAHELMEYKRKHNLYERRRS